MRFIYSSQNYSSQYAGGRSSLGYYLLGLCAASWYALLVTLLYLDL